MHPPKCACGYDRKLWQFGDGRHKCPGCKRLFGVERSVWSIFGQSDVLKRRLVTAFINFTPAYQCRSKEWPEAAVEKFFTYLRVCCALHQKLYGTYGDSIVPIDRSALAVGSANFQDLVFVEFDLQHGQLTAAPLSGPKLKGRAEMARRAGYGDDYQGDRFNAYAWLPVLNGRVMPGRAVQMKTKARRYSRHRGPASRLEVLWAFAKPGLARFNSIPISHFHLYIAQTLWLFQQKPMNATGVRRLKKLSEDTSVKEVKHFLKSTKKPKQPTVRYIHFYDTHI